jgi:hypothetical protein
MIDWNQITRESMTAALDVAHGLDRSGFLKRHPGLGASTKYFAFYRGRQIDSKHLLAEAYAQQFSGSKLLVREDFRGGAETTAVLDAHEIPWADLSAETGVTRDWGIAIGSRRTKEEVAAGYGGSTQGGIQPSGTTPNIMLYSDPLIGAENGYAHDGWSDDGSVFMYTGEGRTGPQKLTNGNRSLLMHATDGRALRLFVSDGRKEKSRAIYRQYVGRFEIDREVPYIVDQSFDRLGENRTVFVFRLRPLGPALRRQADKSSTYTSDVVSTSAASLVDPDTHSSDLYQLPGLDPAIAEKREQRLVDAFTDVLKSRGRTVKAFRITLPYRKKGLRTDIYDVEQRVLYEAKASASRSDIRHALGQILDYKRYLDGKCDRLAILLPSEPAADMVELLAAYEVDTVWRLGDSSRFMHSRAGVRSLF